MATRGGYPQTDEKNPQPLHSLGPHRRSRPWHSATPTDQPTHSATHFRHGYVSPATPLVLTTTKFDDNPYTKKQSSTCLHGMRLHMATMLAQVVQTPQIHDQGKENGTTTAGVTALNHNPAAVEGGIPRTTNADKTKPLKP